MAKTRVNVEYVREVVAMRHRLNQLDLGAVELYEGGVRVEVPEKVKDDWRFTGLCFCDFIASNFYKTGWVDETGQPDPVPATPPVPARGDLPTARAVAAVWGEPDAIGPVPPGYDDGGLAAVMTLRDRLEALKAAGKLAGWEMKQGRGGRKQWTLEVPAAHIEEIYTAVSRFQLTHPHHDFWTTLAEPKADPTNARSVPELTGAESNDAREPVAVGMDGQWVSYAPLQVVAGPAAGRVVEYRLVERQWHDRRDFTHAVNALIAEGWEPVGGVGVTGRESGGLERCVQAMIRRESQSVPARNDPRVG
jgi:hypothetical protein